MKRAALVSALLICLLLSGCGLLGGKSYVWIESRPIPQATAEGRDYSAADYAQLYTALCRLVEAGMKQSSIFVGHYDSRVLDADMQQAMDAVRKDHPIGAYAVAGISYTPGIQNNERVLVVTVDYQYGKTEIGKIKHVADDDAAAAAIYDALNTFEHGIVLLVQDCREQDFVQLVTDYALAHPEQVMEMPEVTENIYPDHGTSRVVELKFQYQTSRDAMRNMQTRVENMFKSATFFASGYQSQHMRYARLYTWLMETNEYTLQTSLTPAYSLLHYGVGDSRAFASVYASLCRRMELECVLISGTKDGESRYWNMVCLDGVYYHLDLLQCEADGALELKTDNQMREYVWDYDAYPKSETPMK